MRQQLPDTAGYPLVVNDISQVVYPGDTFDAPHLVHGCVEVAPRAGRGGKGGKSGPAADDSGASGGADGKEEAGGSTPPDSSEESRT